MNARRVHIGDQAAALLRDAAEAMGTNEIANRLNLDGYERGAYLWRELDRLARSGQVERIVDPQLSCRLWRWIGQQSDQRGGAGTHSERNTDVTTRQTTVNAADPAKGMTAGEISEAIKGLANNQTIKARVGMRGQIKSMTYETASGTSAAPLSP